MRGFNIYSHRSGFKKWSKNNRPIFGGLIETHVKQTKSTKFINELFPGWLFDENYGYSDLGKIWVVWHPSVRAVVISKSLQMVTCEVVWPETQKVFIISVIYASNCAEARKSLWLELVNLSSSQVVCGKPWLFLGILIKPCTLMSTQGQLV